MPKNTSDAGSFLKSKRKRWAAGTQRLAKQANGRKFKELTDREIRAVGCAFETIKEFVERNRDFKSHDCLFVPDAKKGSPANVRHCGKAISAAKYMLLLSQGAPKFDKAVTRHKCGNGHLSCVNPAHLCWGSVGDNVGDMTRHRHAGGNIQDRINSIPE